jgi:FkbM family methyltransferase
MALSDIDGEICIQGRKVKARRLDSLLQEEGIELQSNDIAKIDVEGMALSVLRGCADILERSKPKLVIELHRGEEKVELFLRKLSYRIHKPSEYFIVAL